MPRQPRYRIAGYPQHIVQRGNDRQPTFRAQFDFARYLEYLSAAADMHGCAVHAYCLMTNHVHLLVTPRSVDGIPKLVQSVAHRYVKYFNRMYQRTGTLWEGRYRATLVDTDRYVLACYRYLELNPVRGGIASAPDQYAFSSYRANALGEVDTVICPHPAYLALGATSEARRAAYRGLFATEFAPLLLAEIRKATFSCSVLGSGPSRQRLLSNERRARRDWAREVMSDLESDPKSDPVSDTVSDTKSDPGGFLS